MATLRKRTGHTIGLPAPAWLLEAGAALTGTETELILKSRWAKPARLMAEGFQFKIPKNRRRTESNHKQYAPQKLPPVLITIYTPTCS